MAKHLKSNLQGDFIPIEDTRTKSKPRVVIVPDSLTAYFLARDRQLWKEGKSIDELKLKYGI